MGHLKPEPDKAFIRRLRAAVRGEVLFDDFARGRYATDASIYQIMPRGVVVPKTAADIGATMSLAREADCSIVPRGAGTSQCGQTINDSIVLDLSKYCNRLIDLDVENRTAEVQPGIVLDHLNAYLRQHGLWFPVDVSTGSRATIGGMVGNNSCGTRSIRYGMCRDHVIGIDTILANGTRAHFGEVPPSLEGLNITQDIEALFRELLLFGEREAETIRAGFPDVPRRVGGYNIDALIPSETFCNMAQLLVGSEGTLGLFEKIRIRLSPLPGNRVLGVCHFPSFYEAMDAAQYIVQLGPSAVELFDRTILELARDIPLYRPVIESFVRGAPEALLLVEFAEDEEGENLRRLDILGEVMTGLGFDWDDPRKKDGGVVPATDPAMQARIMEVRKQGLNIMMSMKSEGKPLAFIEDCCVPLEHLADYTDRLKEIFARHGVQGTFYAHASVGTLHVRPVLNLKLDTEVVKLRAIAEETFALVREYDGAHSGEHGDGILRSEFHRMMFGDRMVDHFEWIKHRFDPDGFLNPGRIVEAPKMDDRELMRYGPDYHVPEIKTMFDWPGYTGAGRGLQGAVEMCNNNGACRKLTEGIMCPSYRATRNERDLVRGRANTLRLALSGQLGADALTSDDMAETMRLCLSCKGCRRECPTGVDMARMKIEVQARRIAAHGLTRRDKLFARLPHYAPWARRFSFLLNLRERIPGAARLGEKYLGISAERALPRWSRRAWRPTGGTSLEEAEVVLFADTFNSNFEPQNLAAAETVLERAGLKVAHAAPLSGNRPLCCGRTFLAADLVDEARAEMRR